MPTVIHNYQVCARTRFTPYPIELAQTGRETRHRERSLFLSRS
jgi:hypothetical protein